MNFRDKLNEEATFEAYKYANPDSDEPCYDTDFYEGFKQGADWLMQQPLSERLTDEEKEMIRIMFRHAQTFYKIDWENGNEDGQAAFWRGQYEGLLTIFGADLFKEK